MGRQQLLTAEDLWTEVSERLRSALNESTYRTWFSEAEGLDLSDESFTLPMTLPYSTCAVLSADASRPIHRVSMAATNTRAGDVWEYHKETGWRGTSSD